MSAYNSRSMEHGTADGTRARTPVAADGPAESKGAGAGHGTEHSDAARGVSERR